jgi:transcriptional regulator with XRE-family HTH domain
LKFKNNDLDMNQNELIKKLDSLTSTRKSEWLEEAKQRKQNEAWLRKSQMIAVKILRELRRIDLTQKQLAEKLNVSPQTVNKWIKGKENFTLETISKIESALGITLNISDNVPTTYNTNQIAFEIKLRLKSSTGLYPTTGFALSKKKKTISKIHYNEELAEAS